MPLNQWLPVAAAAFAVSGLLGCRSHAGDSIVVAENSTNATKTFGQRQLEQMLNDRPDMQDAVPPSHPVRQWLIDGFDGKRLGRRVYWVADSPTSGQSADSKGPDEDGLHFIRLSGGTELSAIDKWASAVFEMANREEDWHAVELEALHGKLDADGYARKCVALENSAFNKTAQFFRQHPLRQDRRSEDSWYNWVTSDGVLIEVQSPDAIAKDGNFDYFQKQYEASYLPYVRQGTTTRLNEQAK
jgi:hypothetical protein